MATTFSNITAIACSNTTLPTIYVAATLPGPPAVQGIIRFSSTGNVIGITPLNASAVGSGTGIVDSIVTDLNYDDVNGVLYIADSANGRIFKLNGSTLSEFILGYNYTLHVTSDGTNVYITTGRSLIFKFDTTGQYVDRFIINEITSASSISCNPTYLYVVDNSNNTIQIVNKSTGIYLEQYVTDNIPNLTCVRINNSGDFFSTESQIYTQTPGGPIVIAGSGSTGFQNQGPNGSLNATFSKIVSFDCNALNFFICDGSNGITDNNAIRYFNNDFGSVSTFYDGTTGSGTGGGGGGGAAPCFLEGTKILCQVDWVDTYIPVEKLVPGTLVKTPLNGYKKVALIGSGPIENPGNDERIEQRLYKLSPSKYPELNEDLFITGCHSRLVRKLTDKETEDTIKHVKRVFVTDKQYRLMACVDEKAEPWNSKGQYTIWHFALEHENVKMNHGIYANGLLVESCCLDTLKNKSNFTLH